MPSKVLIVTPIFPPEIGGPATYTKELLNRLQPDFQVSIIGFAQKSTSSDCLRLITIHQNPLARQWEFFMSCLTQGRDADIFFIQEPVVVGLAASLAAMLLGKPLITKFVGDPNWEKNSQSGSGISFQKYVDSGFKWTPLTLLTSFVLHRSTLIIVPAEHLKKMLTLFYNLPPEKIKTIPNSVEIPHHQQKKTAGKLIYVGRLVKHKKVDKILKACQILNNQGQKFTLLIVGDGPEENNLKHLTNTLGLKDLVKFMGKTDTKTSQDQIGRSEILIVYSSYEGLSHTILEAQASKTAVVAADIAGNREVIENNKTGLLVVPEDPEVLAQTLNLILSHKEIREKITIRGLQVIEENFSWEKNLSQLKSLIYEMVAKK